LSPKNSPASKGRSFGQNRNSVDLSLVLVYILSQFNKWPSKKWEVAKYLEKLPLGVIKEILERTWSLIASTVTDQEIEKIVSRDAWTWNTYKNQILQRFSEIEFQTAVFSPSFLGEFVKDLAHSKFGGDVKSVYDPAFGFGNILFSGFDGSLPEKKIWVDEDDQEIEVDATIARRILGTEINVDICKLTNTLGKIFGYNIEVTAANSLILQDPVHSKHQLVVCQPPVGLKLSAESIAQDWSFGRPTSSRSDWAWAQIVHSHISPDGYGLLFLSRGPLFNRLESFIRAKMINSGAIRAVINLPSGSHSSSRLPASLIIFAGRDVPRAKADEILFLSLPEPEKSPSSWEYWSSLFKSIHDACKVFYRFEEGKFERVIGYSAVVNRNDQNLVNNSWNIDPSNYVTQVATGIDIKLNVRKDINLIAKTGNDLADRISQTKDKFATFTVKAEFTTIGEMIKSGKLILLTGMSKNDLKRNQKRNQLSDSTLESYLTVNDLRSAMPLEATGQVSWEGELEDREEIRTEVNDVVFIKTGTPAAKVDYHGGALLFSPLSALRITEKGEKFVTSKILAFILNGDGIKKFMHGTSVGRLAIEKVPIPILNKINRVEINEHLLAVEKLIMRTNELRNQLDALDLMLNKVLSGEFEGLQEAE